MRKASRASRTLRASERFLADDEDLRYCWVMVDPPCTTCRARRFGPGRARHSEVVDAAVFVEASVLCRDKGFCEPGQGLCSMGKSTRFSTKNSPMSSPSALQIWLARMG